MKIYVTSNELFLCKSNTTIVTIKFLFSFINRHRGLYCGLYWFRWWVPQKSGHWEWLHRCLVCGHTHTPGALSETWHCIWLETRTCLCDDRQESVKGMFYYDILRSCFYYILLFLLFSLVFFFHLLQKDLIITEKIDFLFCYIPSIIVKNLCFFDQNLFHVISSVFEKVSGHNL